MDLQVIEKPRAFLDRAFQSLYLLTLFITFLTQLFFFNVAFLTFQFYIICTVERAFIFVKPVGYNPTSLVMHFFSNQPKHENYIFQL